MTEYTAPELPSQHVRAILEKYASCESYCDEGTIDHVWAIDGSSGSRRSLFRTSFVRSERFCFEWIETSNDDSEEHSVNAVLLEDGKGRLNTNGVLREFQSLQEAICKCEWDIESSCGLVASLLMNLPLLNDTKLAELQNLQPVSLSYAGLRGVSGLTKYNQALLIVFDEEFVVRSARLSIVNSAAETRAVMASLQNLANGAGPQQKPRTTVFDNVANAAVDSEGSIRQEIHHVAMNSGHLGKPWHPYSTSVDQWRNKGLR